MSKLNNNLSYELNKESDEKLMELYQQNLNMRSLIFDEFYQRHFGRVQNYLKSKQKQSSLNNTKDSEDLAQEVFLKLHRSAHLYKCGMPFLPWLFTIVKSVFIDHVRKKNLEDLTQSGDFEDNLNSQYSFAQEESFEQQELKEMVEELPVDQQQVVQMRIYEDSTFEEISRTLSITSENARQLFSRGIKKIRQKFFKRSF